MYLTNNIVISIVNSLHNMILKNNQRTKAVKHIICFIAFVL